LTYHLDQLPGVLVEAREDGYPSLGSDGVGALDAHAAVAYAAIDRTELADPCPFCGGGLAASYRREIVGVECLEGGASATAGTSGTHRSRGRRSAPWKSIT